MNNFFDSKHKVISTLLLIVAILLGIYVFATGKNAAEQNREQRIPEITRTSVFICDTNAMEVDYADDIVIVRLSDKRQYTLEETASETGRRFSNEVVGVSFWNDGDKATFEENGAVTFANCNLVSID